MSAGDLHPRLVRHTSLVAAAASLLVFVAVTASYFYAGQRFHEGEMEAEGKVQAYVISQLVSLNPDLWAFQTTRVEDALNTGWNIHPHTENEQHVVIDAAGTIVTEVRHGSDAASEPLRWPVLVRSQPIMDSGRPAGRVEVRRSLRRLMFRTLQVALLAALLAAGVFAGLRLLPLRALRQSVEKVTYLATHDPLTGLPNRALFRDRFEQALALGRRQGELVAVMFLDLDHFKDVNDILGHAAGDRLLVQVAERLRGCLRDSDTLARLGGDEFAMVLSGVGRAEELAIVAERLVRVVAEPFDLDGHEMAVSPSIGIAVDDPRQPSDLDRLLRNADLALYRAKSEGRNGFRFFEEEMNTHLHERKALEQDLRQALAQGQFRLHYQPQVALATQRVLGVEALIRWEHPVRGLVPPNEFIPLAEETGAIVPLGEWVLRTACAQGAAWGDVRVAVNLSPVQFRSPGLDRTIALALQETGLAAELLELEVTEGVLLQETESTLATLNAIKRLGVRIAMDDFGTGYSSLSYLRLFPFDKIKIDRSFVRDLQNRSDASAIVRAVLRLGQSLGMTTNAEGVECPQQAEFLIAEGCDEVQGFHFGRPMPAEQFERWRKQQAMAAPAGIAAAA